MTDLAEVDIRIPQDLVPLPTMPYSQRPDEFPLNIEECRTAIWYSRGNITQAAAILKVPSGRLRQFVAKSQFLTREVGEASEQLIDRAEQIVAEALDDEEDKSRRDGMAKFVLGSARAKQRGWGTGAPSSISVKNTSGGTILMSWGDGTKFQPTVQDNNIIDVTPEREADNA